MRAIALLLCALGVQAPPPVFHSGVDLVRFDVRVTDAAGHPITDLRPEEIQILEHGSPLPIVLFQRIEEPAGAYAQSALRAVAAEVSSNEGTPRGHLYILVFDQQHITVGNEQAARRAAEAFIRTRLRPFDRVAVAGIPGPGPLLGFTADGARAIAELGKVRGAYEPTVNSAYGTYSIEEAYAAANGDDRVIAAISERQSEDASADAGSSSSVADPSRQSRLTAKTQEDPSVSRRIIAENARTVVAHADATSRDALQRLHDLMEQYRGVEGRKTVVFFSEGFHQANVARELEQVEAAAAETYAVFYAFNLNRRGSNADQALASTTTEATDIQARVEPLGSLAAETDGALILDATSHLDAALDRIADQAQDYYLVGFVPGAAADAARDEYRRVSVRVTRPGARVSARTGYALPRPGAPDRRRAIDTALSAPFVQQALRVEYTTYVLRSDTPGRARVILSLDADLPLRDAAHDAADVVFVVRDTRDGRVVASGTDTMPLPSAARPGTASGIGTYHVAFDVPPGSYMMRTVGTRTRWAAGQRGSPVEGAIFCRHGRHRQRI